MLDPRRTVASVVLDHSECAAVFQRHQIDFCCRGEISIEDAATRAHVETDVLLDELARAVAGRQAPRELDLRTLSTPRLVAHIVSKHHEYLRTTLPFVGTLAEKVSRVHGEREPKLRELRALVALLDQTLIAHLDVEEGALFPMLCAKQIDPHEAATELAAMVDEHLIVADLLARIRRATDDFALPDWACNSYRTLFAELRQLETDVFTHVHLENHVLRPRFVASD